MISTTDENDNELPESDADWSLAPCRDRKKRPQATVQLTHNQRTMAAEYYALVAHPTQAVFGCRFAFWSILAVERISKSLTTTCQRIQHHPKLRSTQDNGE
ncbi:MAG: hypothetical protein CMM01_04135 [Rhodopirellula sp.]|nr:hypothetical protein [Rhodopirellula sp.]